MTTPTLTRHQRAADVVLANARDVTDARTLFEMLGLVEPDGCELLPDDNRPVPLVDLGRTPQKANPNSPIALADQDWRPENCTTPPGLRDLPPPEVTKVRRPAKPRTAITPKPRARAAASRRVPDDLRQRRAVAVCGTTGGYARHMRLGEPACAPCRDAKNDYWRVRDAQRRAENGKTTSPRRKVAACGTRSGYARHLRLGEPTCAPCRAANSARNKKADAETARLVAAGVNREAAAFLGERVGLAS